uniref:von Willebrand factor A domain-containing protein 2 n=1 Tax=Pogona vitticeps TaxID=103695 RepID=A0ABM5G1U9_9SAUR
MNLLLLFDSIGILLLSQASVSWSMQELHISLETTEKISAAGQLMNCSAPIDVLFLFDGSYSIGKGSFERSKHLAIKLCDALDIGTKKVRVGAIQFSNTPRSEFSLDAYFTKQKIKDKLKKIVFRGGRTDTGRALKYILLKGFHGGRNSLVPQILIILTDGRSQGDVVTPAKELKERGVVVFAIGVSFPRWEELHALASEPTEQHLLFAEDASDASNGLFTTLTGKAICGAAFPGCRAGAHLCERRTLEREKKLVGHYFCWKGSRSNSAVRTSLCPFYTWRNTFIKYPSRCYRTTCPDPCGSYPCQNGGTCVQQGLERYHCVCPVGYGGDANCAPAPKISMECSVDLLLLVDSSSSTTLEGFLRYKAFLKRFLQTVWRTETPGNVGVAQYSSDVKMTSGVGDYKDVLSLVKDIDSMQFSGGSTLTGQALWFVLQHGFKSTPAFTDISHALPRVVVLLTDANAQDSAVEAAKYSRSQGIFLIGIGSEFLRAELDQITGNPKWTIVYSTPQDLFNKIPELQRKICSIANQGCPSQSLDLVFALDSSASVGRNNFVKLKTFVSRLSLQFDINMAQISLVVFGQRPQTVFGLDTHKHGPALQESITQAPFAGGSASVGSSLLHIHDEVVTVQKGSRPGVKKIVVVITGGAGVEDALVPAQQLRHNDVSLLVVGMGHLQVDPLLRIAGTHDNLWRIPAYEDLKYNEDIIVERICDEAKKPVNICRPNPCMNDGICVPENGRYHCECQGWEGAHCENGIQRGDAFRSRVHPAIVRAQ